MGLIDNLSSGQVKDIFRRLRALENGAPMNNAAIGRGGIEVYDGGVIRITNGGLSVTGTATITGTLQADGTITFTGTFNQSGPTTFTGDTKLNGPTHINGATDITGDTDVTGDLTVTGPTHLNGATDINGNLDVDGTLDINGAATLNNDLTVQGGGKIKAGNVNITPGASNGGIEFVSGGGVGGNGGTVVVKGTGNAGLLSSPDSTSVFAGASSLDVRTDGVYVTLPTTASPANLYADGSGKLYRSTA